MEIVIALLSSFLSRPRRQQVGVLPYRVGEDGQVRILLITSRQSRNWIVPKGNLMPGRSWTEAAAQEAFEEAGVVGQIDDVAIGQYRYQKARPLGLGRPCVVTIFPFEVERQETEWPEQHERSQCWATLGAAARMVRNRELGRVIAAFSPGAHSPAPLLARLGRSIFIPDRKRRWADQR